MLAPLCFVHTLASGRYLIAVPPSSWGASVLSVAVLDEGVGLFSATGDVEELYVARLEGGARGRSVEKFVAKLQLVESRV